MTVNGEVKVVKVEDGGNELAGRFRGVAKVEGGRNGLTRLRNIFATPRSRNPSGLTLAR